MISKAKKLVQYFGFRVKPSAIVVGVQKSGTTSLYRYLSLHPQVCSTTVKEIDFFHCDNSYNKGVGFYHSHFLRCWPWQKRSYSFDITPGYTAGACKAERSAKRIHQYNPDINIIISLRDPCYRAFSAWNMYRNKFVENSNWYFEWIKKDNDDINSSTVIRRKENFGESFLDDIKWELCQYKLGNKIEAPIIEWGLYYDIIKSYYALFDKSQILIVFNEDMDADVETELGRIEKFIGMRPFEWSNIDIKRYHVGTYDCEMDVEVLSILREFYFDSNFKIGNEFGINTTWNIY
ncbi:sulfotransferase family protein [Amphritea balenae]|uniref:Sulfotransferase domain-containing protein n=1 Tax=Amphritea balenae TaxID=452629 RepID=A0A3P1SS23_9GAMM|nr:sulfotransferase domain-containing protein [Amphritea balenae]RRC99983.1 hypothetical protein EHS89_07150 [Amphritea balenae]GGK75614.1 hypothetical protein GCM10007941_27190 [Amphritea balenae]